jgi:predicted PurR-regulated permease PerM
VCVLMVGIAAVLTATVAGERLVQEAVKGAHLVQGRVESGEWLRSIERRPYLAAVAHKIQQNLDLPGNLRAFTTWLSVSAGSIVRSTLIQLAGVALTLYMFFFLLRDRAAALMTIRSVSPLSRRGMDRLLTRVEDTIFATVYGTLAVSLLQGLLGGLMFWWLDLPAPLFWGLLMALLSIVPMLGSSVIWLPAALILLIGGHWGKALILVLWGGIVVGSVDNLLRPILVGRRLKQHTLVAFLSVVGGLLLFGPSGLILGPLCFTLTAVLLESWRLREKPSPEAGSVGSHTHPDTDAWRATRPSTDQSLPGCGGRIRASEEPGV